MRSEIATCISGFHRQRLLDVHLQQVRERAERATHQGTVERLAADVIPERFGFGVLHHEERVVKADVVEVVHRAVDRGNHTGPAIAHHSKRGHPVLAPGVTLGQVVVRHLVGQQRESTGCRLHHEDPSVSDDLPRLQCLL